MSKKNVLPRIEKKKGVAVIGIGKSTYAIVKAQSPATGLTMSNVYKLQRGLWYWYGAYSSEEYARAALLDLASSWEAECESLDQWGK